jgi:hypothetical protein
MWHLIYQVSTTVGERGSQEDISFVKLYHWFQIYVSSKFCLQQCTFMTFLRWTSICFFNAMAIHSQIPKLILKCFHAWPLTSSSWTFLIWHAFLCIKRIYQFLMCPFLVEFVYVYLFHVRLHFSKFFMIWWPQSFL